MSYLLREMIPFIPTHTHTDRQTQTQTDTHTQTDRQTQTLEMGTEHNNEGFSSV